MTDVCVGVMKSGAPRQIGTELGVAVDDLVEQFVSVKDAVITPPQRTVLRVPWEAARISLNLTRWVASKVLFDPASSSDVPRRETSRSSEGQELLENSPPAPVQEEEEELFE